MTDDARPSCPRRLLGRSGLEVSAVGYGAFKIGRNEGSKYPSAYDLPDETAVEALLDGMLDLGITYIDTAPAYGLSEQRLGRAIGHRRRELVLSTKVGETFEDGRSRYDFSASAVTASVHRSLDRLGCETLDLVFVHSDGYDLEIQHDGAAIAALQALKELGLVTAIGFSGKTVAGAEAALGWADALMVEYSLERRDHEEVIERARRGGVGVVVKKGLGSGRLDPEQAVRFVLSNPGVSSLVVGSLSLEHMRRNVAVAEALRSSPRR